MGWEVIYTDEFEQWWQSLNEEEQVSIDRKVLLRIERGPSMTRPHADVIHGSRYPNMKELRCQYEGRPYRVLFIFDPRRNAVLLIGGDKTGDDRSYEGYVPEAERIYADYLEETNRRE